MRCRKSYRDFTDGERQDFIDATIALRGNGTITQWADDHEQHFGVAHGGSAFFPWHRAFLQRIENALRSVKPGVTIPYWNWTAAEDRATNSLLWSPAWMGAFDSWGLNRSLGAGGSLPDINDVNTDLGQGSFTAFRTSLEGTHGAPHNWVGGVMATARSPADPVFWLHHAFIDMIWAYWQRLHPGLTYAPEASDDPGVNEHLHPFTVTPADVENHRVINEYDYLDAWGADPPIVTLDTPSLTFQNVPEGETTMRAVVFDVVSCPAVHFNITNGPTVDGGGANPFGTLMGTSLTANPPADPKARLWISYRATMAGDVHTGKVTIHCDETNLDHEIQLSANTEARPRAVVIMALDRSNSMTFDSGVGPGITRGEVLQFSTPPFTTVIGDQQSVGIIAFDHDPADLLGVTAADAPGRLQLAATFAGYAPNPQGWTSIGEAVARANDLLTPQTNFQVKAIVVLTDGQENHGPHTRRYIADVADLIQGQVYAIGLGTPEVLNPAALQALCDGHDGYLYMTGALGPDAFFRVAKYYQQILVGITNQDIVRDPEGWVHPGEIHRIPYDITEADIDSTILALTPAPGFLMMGLETPDGEIITPTNLAPYPTVRFVTGPYSEHYEVNYPVATQSGVAHAGRWHALLALQPRGGTGHDITRTSAVAWNTASEAFAHGIRYSLSVHSYSNLRLRGHLDQSSYEPGASVTIRASLTEYDVPVGPRGSIKASVTQPDDSKFPLDLTLQNDNWSGSFIAPISGVYQVKLAASGVTLRMKQFTREQDLTAAVWKGGSQPPPRTDPAAGDGRRALCMLLSCLLRDQGIQALLKRHEIDLNHLWRCLARICSEKTVDSAAAETFVKNILSQEEVLRRIAELVIGDRPG